MAETILVRIVSASFMPVVGPVFKDGKGRTTVRTYRGAVGIEDAAFCAIDQTSCRLKYLS
jgi:hypothetical protein